MEHKLFIVDAYGFIFRAYHIQPELRNEEGIATGALYGFTNMMFKLLNDFRPQFITLVFDGGGRGFRQELYPQYKAHRPATPDDLKQQLPLIRKAAEALNICVVSDRDYEADDLIASLAHQYQATHEIIIVSSDKDLMQLITPRISLYDPTKNCYIREPEVVTKFGILPTQLQDWLAVVGDRADNIPGITGVGPKTATELLKNFGTLENILANTAAIPQKKLRENIEQFRDTVAIFKQIIGLKMDLNCNLTVEQLTWQAPKRSLLYDFLRKYNFNSFLTKAERLFNLAPAYQVITPTTSAIVQEVVDTHVKHLVIAEESALAQVLLQIYETGVVAFLLVSDQLFISFENNVDKVVITVPAIKPMLEILASYLQDLSVRKITYNLKATMKQLVALGISVNDIVTTDDLMLMHYVLNTGKPQPSLELLLAAFVKDNDELPIVQHMISQYKLLTKQLLDARGLVLYYEIELPMTRLLFAMEQQGIALDSELLDKLSRELEQQISNLTKNIFSIAGQEFNIGSPKQLGEVLFEKLRLPHSKLNSKSKNYSTNFEVLEGLKEAGFGIANDLLEWRQLTKLKNTYVDTLPKQVNATTQRIHTTFLQTSTNTARLSSVNPNLQNIPIRSLEGNKIRAAFIPIKGYCLISADYSQIELRILSSLANISALKEAFIHGRDIHAQTASQVFNLSSEQLSPEHRRRAKAINFGIIYGISPFGLAKQLGISTYEAKNYMDRYFAEYPEIEEYMEYTKIFAKQNHFVLNLLGRKCFILDIQSNNSIIRGFAERAAINAPIQSTAADIVKMAMLAVVPALKPYHTNLLLQVHDELIFEAPEGTIDAVTKIIKHQLENIIELSIPLTVSIKAGKSWADIH